MYRTHPQSSFSIDGSAYQSVVPADLANIYNFNPLFAAGITGKGETIATIEDSDVYSPGAAISSGFRPVEIQLRHSAEHSSQQPATMIA